MRLIKKYFLLIVLFIVAAFSLELWRERVVYRHVSTALAKSCRQLQHGMTKEEVVKILGAPESAATGWSWKGWYWSAQDNQGILWGWLRLNRVKGHFGVAVGFGEQGKVVEIDCGVN